MILVLEPNTDPAGADWRILTGQLERLPSIQYRVHREVGSEVTLTEIYLIGNTAALTVEQMQVLPCVAKVVRVSEPYRVLGRHKQGDDRPSSFEYNGVRFGQDTLHVFAGPVRGRLARIGRGDDAGAARRTARCARAWARTSRARRPYAFQGYGAKCLPYVFELAGKYGIRVIAMEVTHESHVDEIRDALAHDRQPHRRDAADRHAQHAELRAPEAGGQAAGLPGADQARLRHHARRVAQRRRVPRHRGQPQGRLLPARHEDEHGRSASQLRRLRARAGGQAAHAHAGCDRPVALGRHARRGARRPARHLPRRRAGRHRRRQHGAGRLPSASGEGAGGRPAGAAALRAAAVPRRRRARTRDVRARARSAPARRA